MTYTKASIIQQPTADYLEQQLGWESVYAYHSEAFGPASLLGRASDHEVVVDAQVVREVGRIESAHCSDIH